MAFTATNFVSMNTSNTDAGDIFQYKETDTAIATIVGANYFNNAAISLGLKTGDSIYIVASDEVRLCVMTIDGSDDVTVDYFTNASVSTTPQVIVTANTYSPTAVQSGTIFLLAVEDGCAVTLPAAAVGLKYTFIHSAPVLVSANSHVITATDTVIQGSLVLGGVVELAAAADTITMPHTVSIIGDQFTIEADATNWYISGIGSTDDSILPTDES